ncbi:uncharacterized protein MONOS_4455 [Monocercomonoides exilis]|uniref:uncharacterized protein n=1 Tax=Monocercomonoides exilis TaxID=2049356 RepID=UPI003559F56C|nr:hypothetical protein MONOS_4455 [Monocercomonoides exilis]|eukprot:MONOS_4455.1-p1 / transcript=MONOS_4455.1 / gene=MONOS_4455 / organism=Monocercomonoides_exilis_PA203 / gene_product=unspecified product / transcript_product=unspecified product / location=Mono_scaffold00118:93904-99493(-) / protein_length=1844 / sequence_SO=supercontig / SO=protein_coding / is_pseudo=false
MITLSAFRIDTATGNVNLIAYYICFLDGTSLSYLAGKYVSFAVIGCFTILILLIADLIVCAIFYRAIVSMQPWVIQTLQWLTNFILTFLFIPFTTIAITSFDCYESNDKNILHRVFNETCFGTVVTVLGFVFGILLLIILLMYSYLVNSVIYNHNSKHGGIFSSPLGSWHSIETTLMFGCVFAMRMLYAWPFWRGVVTVGTSLFMVLYFIWAQPIYKLRGNLLKASTWCIFGCLRLCEEIGYAVENASNSIVATIVFCAVGLIAGILVSAIALPKLGKKFRVKQYLLSSNGRPLHDSMNEGGKQLNLKNKTPQQIERSLRFVQEDTCHSLDHYLFVDYVYTHYIKGSKEKAEACFYYANFLSYYRKNWRKSQMLLRQAQNEKPRFSLNFVIFCKTKGGIGGEGGGEGGEGGNRMLTELNSLTFSALLSRAQEHHEIAISSLKEFFEISSSRFPDYKQIPALLDLIVKNESEARSCYEELIAAYPQNPAVLRSYARLLLDVYHDEDTAEMILNRADHIEEDATASSSLIPTASGGMVEGDTEDNLLQTDGNWKEKGGDTNNSTSQATDFNAGSLKDANDEDGKGSSTNLKEANDSKTDNNGASEPNSAHKEEGGSGETKSLTSAFTRLTNDQQLEFQKMNPATKSSNVLRKKKKKRKKGSGETMISDIAYGSREKESQNVRVIVPLFLLLLHFLAIMSIVIILCVYVFMANNYKNNLSTLREICDLSLITTRSAVLAYEAFLHDVFYKYSWTPIDDGWGNSLMSPSQIKQSLSDTADSMTTLLNKVHQITTNLEPWEAVDVQTYLFTLTLKNVTLPDGTVEEQIDTKKQFLSPDSMFGVLATLSQMSRELSQADFQTRPTYASYLADIQYMVLNPVIPILDGSKRVIISYWELMNAACNTMIIVTTLVVLCTIGTLGTIILILFIRFTLTIKHERSEAYHTLLEVPKISMQGVIRQIVQDEDEEHDTTAFMTTDHSPSQSEPQSEEQMPETDANEVSAVNEIDKFSGKQKEGQENECETSQFVTSGSALENGHTNLSPRFSRNSFLLSTSFQPLQSLQQTQSLLAFPLKPMDNASQLDSPSVHSQLTNSPDGNAPSIAQTFPLFPSTPQKSFALSTPKLGTSKAIVDTNESGFELDEKQMRSPTFSSPLQGVQRFPLDDLNVGGSSLAGGIDLTHLSNEQFTQPMNSIISVQRLSQANSAPLHINMMSSHPLGNGHTIATPENSWSVYDKSTSPIVGPFSEILSQQPSFYDAQQSGIGSIFDAHLIPSPTPMQQPHYRHSFPLSSTSQMAADASSHLLAPIGSPLNMQRAISAQPPSPKSAAAQPSPANEAASTEKEQKVAVVSQLQNYDDDEEERILQMGFVRNAIEDTQWEEKMDKDIEDLTTSYKQFPSPITAGIILKIVISMCIGVISIAGPTIVVVVNVGIFQPRSANIIISGMRTSILYQIQMMTMCLQKPIEILALGQILTFPSSTNPILCNSSYLSGSRDEPLDLLISMSRYFNAVHMDNHFGDSIYTVSGDPTYDQVKVNRMKQANNYKMLVQRRECFTTKDVSCSTLDKKRMYGVVREFNGLSSLVARMKVYIERLQKLDLTLMSQTTPETRYIFTAIRYDLTEGISKITNEILKTGQSEVQNSVVIMIVVCVGCIVLFLYSMVFAAFGWKRRLFFISHVSKKLIELLPIDEDAKEMSFLPLMETGNPLLDSGRRKIMENGQLFFASSKQKEPMEVLTTIYKQLMMTTKMTFDQEEKDMERHNYPNIQKHKQEHLLLRQRLTLLSDQLRSGNPAAVAIAKRRLKVVYETHFIGEDVAYAEFLSQEENMRNDTSIAQSNNGKSSDGKVLEVGAMV